MRTESSCKFLGCDEQALPHHIGGFGEYCAYHKKGGIFGSGESYEQYQIIEEDFLGFMKVVPLEQNHFNIYSPVLRDIIIRTCIQIEIFFKEWAKTECSLNSDFPLYAKYHALGKNGSLKRERNWQMRDFFVFKEKFDHYSRIHVLPLETYIQPYEDWEEKKPPFWWNIYNEIKHAGHVKKKKEYYKAALGTLTNSIRTTCMTFITILLSWKN